MAFNTANSAAARLAGAGILRQVGRGAGRNRVSACAAWLDILKEGT